MIKKNLTKENLEMDMTTYKKVKGTIDPKTTIKITGDKPLTTSMGGQMGENEIIGSENQDQSIKYLSNVKDAKSGEISKTFTIADKRYQMVRGITPSREVVMGVYCHDELNENGENIIHPVDYFDKNIATPMKEAMGMVGKDIAVSEYDYSGEERDFNDKEDLIRYLNLGDIEPQYKHFFLNIRTGKVTAKFKSTKEMIKSGVKLGPDEDYVDLKGLKKFRFGDYFKKDMNETEMNSENNGTDVNKLQADVKKLATLIKNKFSMYLTKLDKPIEQAQFLTAMANEIGVPLNKLSMIINDFKEISKNEPLQESKIFTKKELETKLKIN